MADGILADVEASGIYQIRNLVNGKRYIGSAVCIRKRWNVHRHGFRHGTHQNRYLQAAWLKHGRDAFVFEIIENCERSELVRREQHWIDELSPAYNLSPTAGNCLGVKHSEETRKRISERNRGNKYCVGRSPSDKCIAAIKEANRKRKGYRRTPDSVEKTAAAHRGMKRSAETRRRISEARKGSKLKVPRSAEYRAKLSESLRGKQKSPEHAAAFQAGRAAVVYTEDRKRRMSDELKRQYAEGVRSAEKSEAHKNKIGQHYAKLTDDQVMEIRILRASGVSGVELAKRYVSNPGTISAICNGKRYRWVA